MFVDDKLKTEFSANAIVAVLSDRSFGRFFLAGMDSGPSKGRKTVTIHASGETLNGEQERNLRAAIRGKDGAVRVRVRRYSLKTLGAARSLETFYEPFKHEEILSDPTGAFVRARGLLEFTSDLRVRLGECVGKIFWRAESGELLVVTKSDVGNQKDTFVAKTKESAEGLLECYSVSSIRRYVRKVRIIGEEPTGKLTPVDEMSVANEAFFGAMFGIARKFAAAAALLGLSGMMPSHARAVSDGEIPTLMPGISALPGLTSLGEDVFGTTALPRAFGGLRIYFGNSEPVLLAHCGLLYGFTPCSPRLRYDGGNSDDRVKKPLGYST